MSECFQELIVWHVMRNFFLKIIDYVCLLFTAKNKINTKNVLSMSRRICFLRRPWIKMLSFINIFCIACWRKVFFDVRKESKDKIHYATRKEEIFFIVSTIVSKQRKWKHWVWPCDWNKWRREQKLLLKVNAARLECLHTHQRSARK